MDTETEVENIYTKCSGHGIHSKCWPEECIQVPPEPSPDNKNATKGEWSLVKGKKRPAPATSPKDVILKQITSTYEEDLLEAMDLSKRCMDGVKDEEADLEQAVERSLRESTKKVTEDEQIKLAIKASLEDIIKTGTAIEAINKHLPADLGSQSWTTEELAGVEKVACQATPSTTGEIGQAMAALQKP